MRSSKRTDEGRSATPTTDKKKRRTSIEPENLSVAEQRQRAKEWAEKEKQKMADAEVAATAEANVIEKKVKRATKAKKEVEDVVEESTTEVVKVTRKSSRKPANAEEEVQVAVPSSPVIVKKPTRAKRTSISVPPVIEPVETSFVSSPIRSVEQQQTFSTQSPAKSPVNSPVKSALQQQQPTSALKTRTPRKQVSSSVTASPYLPVKTDDDEVSAASQQTNKANAQKTISSSSTDNSAQVEGDSDIKVVRVVDSFEASPSGLIAVFVLLAAWAAFVIKYIENLSVVLAVAVVGALVVSTVRRWSVFMCCGSKRKDGSHYYLTSAANNNQFMEE